MFRPFVFAFILLTTLSFAAAQEPPPKIDRPNIVLIVADDLGWGDLGCYGQKKIRTPNLDRMAKEGLRFTQFYSGSPVCAPSRCVLMTGKHNGHAAVRDNREQKPEGQYPLPEAETTIAETLKSRGYTCGAIGKWGLGPIDSVGSPLTQGFDSFFGYICQRHAHNHYPAWLWNDREKVSLLEETETPNGVKDPEKADIFNVYSPMGQKFAGDVLEDEALKFLNTNKENPFFLFFASTIPHLALQVPEDSLREYEDQWDETPYDGKQGYLPHPTPRAAYAAMVSRLDRSVGRILEELKKLNLDEKTIVLFSSDNGATHENVGGADSKFFESVGPLRGFKGSAYEGGLRVPGIARWPGKIAAEKTSETPVAFCDVLPTIAELAGATSPEGIDGVSFAATLTGETQKPREFLYWEFSGYTGSQVVRKGNWKGIRSQLRKKETRMELYDLAADPSEKADLAEKHPEIVRDLERIMSEQHVRSEEFPLPAIDPMPDPPAKNVAPMKEAGEKKDS